MATHNFLNTVLLIVFSASACFSNQSLAETKVGSGDSDNVEVVVISDIDDTIASSHIRGNPIRVFGHAINYNDAFIGMAALYRSLADNGANMFYVSGTPSVVDKVIKGATGFLQVNSFPVDDIFLRQSMKDDTYSFKVRTITGILNSLRQKKPHKKFHIIAPGDNGEQDIRVLETVSKTFPDMKIDVYIHKLYEDGVLKIQEGQAPYYTAADLALQIFNSELNQNGKILSHDQLTRVFEQVGIGLSSSERKKRALVIPAWAELTDMDQKMIQNIMSKSPSPLAGMSQQVTEGISARIHENATDHERQEKRELRVIDFSPGP